MATLLVVLSTMVTLAEDGLPGYAEPGSIGGPSLAKRSPPMLPSSLPRSITCLLDRFRGCFTAPTFTTFCGLACGFWAQPGLRTVCGMLIGARLQQAWHHSRAHRFFATARWSADQLGLVLLDLTLATLVPAGAPLRPHDLRGRLAPRPARPRPPPHRLGQQLGGAGRAGGPAAAPTPAGLPAHPGQTVAARAHPRAAGPGHRAGQAGLRPPRRPPRRPGLRRRLRRPPTPRAARPGHRHRAVARRRRPAPAPPATPARPARPTPQQRRPAARPDPARRHGRHPVRAAPGHPLRPPRRGRHRLLHVPVAKRVRHPPGPGGAGPRP